MTTERGGRETGRPRLEVHLLGAPRVVVDGVPRPAPPGHKVWGLLTYLLLRRTPADRGHVAGLLFPGADDPLASLRWALSMLRRFLGDAGTVEGDPLTVTRTGDVWVDVLALRDAGPDDAGHFDPAADLLAGLAFPGCPSFEIWLEAQRRHTRGAAGSLLHEAALDRLARGDADGAAGLAARLVALDPYDENHQVLLVRSLATGGHGVEAAKAAAACRALFHAELGVEPSPALEAAMITTTAEPTSPAVTGRPAVVALLEAGAAAIGAGAPDAGLQVLRRAVADAGALGDGALAARGLTALGSALVRAGRGSDEEGATALHRAIVTPGAEPATLATALSELAYIEFLRGRYNRVERWLARAEEACAAPGGDPAQRAAVLTVRGGAASDGGRYGDALEAFGAAVALPAGDRRIAYLHSMIGRVHLLRGDLDAAAQALDDALDRTGAAGWATFLPWPESLRAEVDLRRGDVAVARERLEHAFALGCRIGDPCWEGMSGRGLGLVRLAEGDVAGAVETLIDAGRRATRLPDGYQWTRAYVFDALAGIGVTHGLAPAGLWVAELAALSERTGMVELCARAALHRHHLGEAGALDAARAMGAGVDNPALHTLLAG
jgi:DNA-binding SARP family transcriptional activator